MILLSVLLSFLVSLLSCLSFLYFYRRRIHRELETETIIRKLKTEIGEMVTALNGTTERNIALLENKIQAVNELIQKAGKAAGALKREQEKQELVSHVYSSLARSRPLNLDVEEISATDSSSDMEIVNSEESPADPPKMDFDSLSIREKALVLHRKGENPDSIASRLDMSRGEIELIISLHERRI